MDYDLWKTSSPDDWYDTSLENIEVSYGKDWLEEVIKTIYITGDISELENALGELAAIYDVKLPKVDPLLRVDVIESMRREIQKLRSKLEENK